SMSALHVRLHNILFLRECDLAFLTPHMLFGAPGTAPAIITRPFASSFEITRRFFDVTCCAPMCPAIFWPLYTRPGVVPDPIDPGARCRSDWPCVFGPPWKFHRRTPPAN